MRNTVLTAIVLLALGTGVRTCAQAQTPPPSTQPVATAPAAGDTKAQQDALKDKEGDAKQQAKAAKAQAKADKAQRKALKENDKAARKNAGTAAASPR